MHMAHPPGSFYSIPRASAAERGCCPQNRAANPPPLIRTCALAPWRNNNAISPALREPAGQGRRAGRRRGAPADARTPRPRTSRWRGRRTGLGSCRHRDSEPRARHRRQAGEVGLGWETITNGEKLDVVQGCTAGGAKRIQSSGSKTSWGVERLEDGRGCFTVPPRHVRRSRSHWLARLKDERRRREVEEPPHVHTSLAHANALLGHGREPGDFGTALLHAISRGPALRRSEVHITKARQALAALATPAGQRGRAQVRVCVRAQQPRPYRS